MEREELRRPSKYLGSASAGHLLENVATSLRESASRRLSSVRTPGIRSSLWPERSLGSAARVALSRPNDSDQGGDEPVDVATREVMCLPFGHARISGRTIRSFCHKVFGSKCLPVYTEVRSYT